MPSASDSVLTSVKKLLGLDESYTVFDLDLILHINGVFSTLNQLGVGPDDGYAIEDAEDVWSDFLDDDPRLNNVKTYMVLKVKTFFDPPDNRYLAGAIDAQIKELEWRLNVQREGLAWELPT